MACCGWESLASASLSGYQIQGRNCDGRMVLCRLSLHRAFASAQIQHVELWLILGREWTEHHGIGQGAEADKIGICCT